MLRLLSLITILLEEVVKPAPFWLTVRSHVFNPPAAPRAPHRSLKELRTPKCGKGPPAQPAARRRSQTNSKRNLPSPAPRFASSLIISRPSSKTFSPSTSSPFPRSRQSHYNANIHAHTHTTEVSLLYQDTDAALLPKIEHGTMRVSLSFSRSLVPSLSLRLYLTRSASLSLSLSLSLSRSPSPLSSLKTP